MNSEFLNNLQKSLRSETVPKDTIDKISQSYKNYILEATARGENEATITKNLGNPVNLATDLRQKLDIKPNIVSEKKDIKFEEVDNKQKRSLGAIFGSLLLVFIINLFAVPLTIAGFGLLIGLLLIPVAAIGLGVSLIIYNAIFINGFKIAFSILTSISLGIGIIGLSIFIIIGVYYLIKYFAQLTALFYSYESNLIRRYK